MVVRATARLHLMCSKHVLISCETGSTSGELTIHVSAVHVVAAQLCWLTPRLACNSDALPPARRADHAVPEMVSKSCHLDPGSHYNTAWQRLSACLLD